MQQTIYPTKVEMRGAVEAYLKQNHLEFYEKHTEVQWTACYNEKVHKDVSSLFIVYFQVCIDKNINLSSKVIKATSFLTRFISYKNTGCSFCNVWRAATTID